MIADLKSELKIIENDLYWISSILVIIFIFLAWFGGDLLDLSSFGFEVIFPFFAAIAVGEWGKTRADDNYDIIAAQSKALSKWVISRYMAIMGTVCVFAFITFVVVTYIRNEMSMWEAFFVYFPTAFFLSSLSSLIGIFCSQEHIATLICGVICLTSLMASDLLRLPGIQYFYLFICFATDKNSVWILNKIILCMLSMVLWGVIFWKCRQQR